MRGFAEKKVVGGKMVKVRVEFNQQITGIRFFGDFFLHPEETLEAIEQAFLNAPIHFDSVSLEQKIQQILQKKNAELVGLAPADFAAVTQGAIQNAGTK